MRPGKTQISLGIRPVWSESSLSTWRNLWALATYWAHSEVSDQTGWMQRLIWGFNGRICHFVGFVVMRPKYLLSYRFSGIKFQMAGSTMRLFPTNPRLQTRSLSCSTCTLNWRQSWGLSYASTFETLCLAKVCYIANFTRKMADKDYLRMLWRLIFISLQIIEYNLLHV